MSASTGAATAKRAAVSQPASSQPRASLDSGTVRPQMRPAAVSAARAERRSVVIVNHSIDQYGGKVHESLTDAPLYERIVRQMPTPLDEIDVKLLTELET